MRRDLFGRILVYLCQFIGYASVTLMVFLDYLVAIPVLGRPIIAPSPTGWAWKSSPACCWPMPSRPGRCISSSGIYIAKETRYLMWSNGVGAAVTVAGNLLLVPRPGPVGRDPVRHASATWSSPCMITRRSQRLFPIDLRPRTWRPSSSGWPWAGPWGSRCRPIRSGSGPGLRLGALAIFYVLPLCWASSRSGSCAPAASRRP